MHINILGKCETRWKGTGMTSCSYNIFHSPRRNHHRNVFNVPCPSTCWAGRSLPLLAGTTPSFTVVSELFWRLTWLEYSNFLLTMLFLNQFSPMFKPRRMSICSTLLVHSILRLEPSYAISCSALWSTQQRSFASDKRYNKHILNELEIARRKNEQDVVQMAGIKTETGKVVNWIAEKENCIPPTPNRTHERQEDMNRKLSEAANNARWNNF